MMIITLFDNNNNKIEMHFIMTLRLRGVLNGDNGYSGKWREKRKQHLALGGCGCSGGCVMLTKLTNINCKKSYPPIFASFFISCQALIV